MIQVTHNQQQKQVVRDTWHIQIINLFEHLQHRFHIDTMAEIYSDYVEQACHLEDDNNDSEKTQSLSRDTAKALSAASLLYDSNGLH
jgi:hypothetical protein